MNSVVSHGAKVPAMSSGAIGKLLTLQADLAHLPQEQIATHHVLHGGIYTRTILIKKGVFIIGALVKVPTTLIIDGDCTVNIGEEIIRLKGHCVIPASANRKQAFVANKDTYLSMSFTTNAVTIEQAEDEFTDDGSLLVSRKEGAINQITITGE